MKAELVKKEGNKVTLKITVDNNKFEEAVNKAYNKTKGKYNIPGFRKGKAPKVVIETQYGKGVFYNDAIDMLFPEVYPEAIKELNIDPIDRPDLDIEEISKDNGLVMVVNVEVKPEFELGAYKGIEISKVDNTVSEEDVEARLNEMVNRNARLTSVEDKALENGDPEAEALWKRFRDLRLNEIERVYDIQSIALRSKYGVFTSDSPTTIALRSSSDKTSLIINLILPPL